MAGRLLVACLLSAALAFLLLTSYGNNVEAGTYKVIYTPFTLGCNGPDGQAYVPGVTPNDDTCTCATGGPYDLDECADLATTFDIPATTWGDPDYANFDRINTFHAPPEWGLAPAGVAPVGSYAGMLYANTTLSLNNSPCTAGFNIVAPIPLYHCSTDNSPGNQITWASEGSNLTADGDGDGIPNGCEQYPAHVDILVDGRKPFVRLYGFNNIVDASPPTQINFVVFQPGQLTVDKDGVAITTSPDKDLGDSLGYSNAVIMDNDLTPEEPQAITDFCTPLQTNTFIFGTTGGEGEVIPVAGTKPELSIGCTNWQGVNLIQPDGAGTPPGNSDPLNDSVPDDGCWVVTDWCGDGVDNDSDGKIDEMCDVVVQHNPNAAVGGITSGVYDTATHLIGTYTEGYRDDDQDGFSNQMDACAQTYSTNVDNTYGCDGCPPGTCTLVDQDGDTYLNRQDRCALDIDDQTDTDTDYIGDACDSSPDTATGPYVSAMPRVAVCVAGTDPDGGPTGDTDDDGWCNTTEDIVASEALSDSGDGDSTPEYIGLDYPVDAADDPPGAAPGTCSDRAWYATATDPNGPGGTVDNDGDGDYNGDDANCAAIGSDDDQDGVPNTSDNCQAVPNPEQLDTDGDGAGDACEGEDDDDGRTDIDEWKCGQNAKSACDPFDTNDDNAVNVMDILLFKPELGGSNPTFDHNCDGPVNVMDILLYKPVLSGSKPCPYQYG